MNEIGDTARDDARYAAIVARDPRFDGVFFVAVSTTGIYCRPICPARTPGRARCTFYDTAAQAEAAGYRACFRCRPELAPGNADVDAVDNLVAAAAERISEGALNERSVEELAAELGVSDRHLRRSMEMRLGVSPVALAQTRRLGMAKQLLQDTALSLTEIAFAAGFGSVRRFNALFQQVMGSSPSNLRRTHVQRAQRGRAPSGLALRLDFRPPLDFDDMLGFLAPRAIPGVEHVDRAAGVYRRVVRLEAVAGVIEVTRVPGRSALALSVEPALAPVVMPLVARVRRLFDLDARPDVIGARLSRDRWLAAHVARRPGMRVPGAVDGFEAAVRALLGQQVSVAAATTLAGRFAAQFGTRLGGEARADGLGVRFPTAAEVATRRPADIAKIGLPGTRAAAIHRLACAIATGELRLEGVRDLEAFVAAATALPGVGPWTAHYLAMRALHVPDAFPAADLGVRKALGGAKPKDIEARAEAWRPFRSYAVMHLWASLGGSDETRDDDVLRIDDGPLADRPTAAGRRHRRDHAPVSPAARRTGRGAGRLDAAARARRGAARRVLRR